MTLLLVGLGMKAGLVPLHFWMPLAYGEAPIPAAAVMSGAVVKASIIALLRFLPLGSALPDFGLPLAALGLFGALYGVAIGITQTKPKVVLAYSSVSQMGFLVAVIGMGLAAGDGGTAMAAAFYAAHHLLVKGALFLAVGCVLRRGRRRLWPMLVPAAVIGARPGRPAADRRRAGQVRGQGPARRWPGVERGACFRRSPAACLMIHFVRRLAASAADDPEARAPAALRCSWLAMALASLVVPWALYLEIPIDTLPKALAPAALWAALWPVLVGAVLAWLLERLGGRLPRIPAGDIGIALGRLQGAVLAFARRLRPAWTLRAALDRRRALHCCYCRCCSAAH